MGVYLNTDLELVLWTMFVWIPPADMYHSFLEVFAVISPVHLVGSRLVKVVVVVWGHDAQPLFLLSIGALYQLKDNSADRRAVTHKSCVY